MTASNQAVYAAGPARGTVRTLDELEGDTRVARITSDYVAKARVALERARRLRLVADETHARALDAVAAEWAEAARVLAEAALLEQQATTLRRLAVASGQRAAREKLLAEDARVRIDKLKALLERAENEAKQRVLPAAKAPRRGDGAAKPTRPHNPRGR